MRLAILGKYLGDRHLRGAFDFLVRIDKRQTQQAGQFSAHGGLANTHHADQHDRTVELLGDPLNIAVREDVVLHCRVAYTWARAKRKRPPSGLFPDAGGPGNATRRRQVKIGVGKLGFSLAAGVVIVVVVAIAAAAWIRGGVQPAQMVEIPVNQSSLHAGGA